MYCLWMMHLVNSLRSSMSDLKAVLGPNMSPHDPSLPTSWGPWSVWRESSPRVSHTLTPSHPHTPTTGSVVRPKVVKSVHYCPATGKTIERKYSDLTSLEPFPTTASYPTKVRGRPHPLHPPQWCPIGRGWQFAGDGIWPVGVQGSPDPQYPGNPRESSGGAAASSSGRHS